MAADGSSNLQQILQNVLDQLNQALRVSVIGSVPVTLQDPLPVSFSGGTQAVLIDSIDDSVSIGDATTGNKATVVGNSLQVAVTNTPTVVEASSTTFQPKTLTVTTTPQQLVFASLAQVTSMSIVAFGTNTDNILISVVSGANVANSFSLFPGYACNLPVSSAATVWVTAASGSQQVTVVAVN